jgi:sRNA-binding carbon storage regulator CsrA
MTIDNDSDFKAALGELPRAGQRLVAARFVENVLSLSRDAKVKSAISAAKRTDITEDELAAAVQTANKASVDSFTQCGHECDWNKQASHFVAEATLACIKPAEPGGNPAWDAAMHARMARTCESIASGHGTDNAEAVAQYRILAEFTNK